MRVKKRVPRFRPNLFLSNGPCKQIKGAKYVRNGKRVACNH